MNAPVEFIPPRINVEEKLFQDRYRVDVGRPHIQVRDPQACKHCAKPCAVCCPAGCWSVTEQGGIDLVVDGCLECGTCRLVCDHDNVDWNYPRGGFGILFKFG
ncbi:ferredoxin family protein [Pseudothauera nasutitermitis]|uniref:Ferredoxin-like protein n=1 Tax=Pseudothauera nasutitermitis TaxID=2565930 RepID=A0A4S4AP54_9RHOO|nr:4Fe-4S dicluster domain-containing protein [Pseudothauera nasutitermitis]THF61450.1 ferredoxin family protein [Pseudothauera nasutitermitis]